jgi:hypothetical protein
MPSVKRRASNILNEYGAAQSELIGKAVVLADGKAGTVEPHGTLVLAKVFSPFGSFATGLSQRQVAWVRYAAESGNALGLR